MSSENSRPEGAPVSTEPAPKKKKSFALPIVVVLLVVAGIYGYRTYSFNSAHASTDDAQVTSDLVQIAPKVAGTVTNVLVKENEMVKKGQLIAVIDPAPFQTAVDQARANLELAKAQAKEADVNVNLTNQVGAAQVTQAQGQLEQSQGAIGGAIADVSRSISGVATARAQASSARSNIYSAQAALKVAIANLKKANDGVAQAAALVENARSASHAAEANIQAQRATVERTGRDAERAQSLLKEGVISSQAADQATTAYTVAQSQLQSLQEQAASARALISQRQAELSTARSQVDASQAAIAQARAGIQASTDQADAAEQAVRSAQAASQAAQTSVKQAQARSHAAQGGLQEAQTASTQVLAKKAGTEQANARVDQAAAVLKDAELKLAWTKVYAPIDGRVSKKTAIIGAQVQVGTPLLTLVIDETPWVIANFKETQLADVRVGQPAEIEPDAMGGVVLKGHVDSLSAGTGATFALLPPDNATGNFTKVVQRVPVKIVLEPGQERLKDLRAGLSVVATITTKGN